MNLDIQIVSQEFRQTLQINNWLNNIGNHQNYGSSILSPFNIQFITEKDRVYRCMKADAWTNIDIDVFNDILEFLEMHSIDGSIINNLAAESKNIFDENKTYLTHRLISYKINENVADYILMPALVRGFQEFYVSRLHKNMLINFNRNLISLLNLGYLPCGWKYSPIWKNHPNNLVVHLDNSSKENLKTHVKSFDYSSGTLYLF